jgi:FG-GAP repeat
VNTGAVRRLLISTFAALAAAPMARAELPRLQTTQTLRPLPEEVTPAPQQFPESPLFGSSLALAGNTALSGMPGAFADAGRVAIFTRRNGSWVRTGTLQATDGASGAGFGRDVALAQARALVASRTGVYVFASSNGTWSQTQKLTFDVPVQISDLDWNGSVAIVGTLSNGVYAFGLTSSGQLQRFAKFTAHDTVPEDRFGSRVAIAGTVVAITAPGYNSNQGAAYYFVCGLTSCRERQKLLANDGKPGDGFGSSVAIRTHVLVVGASGADPARPEDDGALGAGYLFVRPNSTWIETQKLGATAAESEAYRGLGSGVVLTQDRVLLGAVGLPGFADGVVFVYDFSGGSFVPTHMMVGQAGFGVRLAAVGNIAIVGTPSNSSSLPEGQADVFQLPPQIP